MNQLNTGRLSKATLIGWSCLFTLVISACGSPSEITQTEGDGPDLRLSVSDHRFDIPDNYFAVHPNRARKRRDVYYVDSFAIEATTDEFKARAPTQSTTNFFLNNRHNELTLLVVESSGNNAPEVVDRIFERNMRDLKVVQAEQTEEGIHQVVEKRESSSLKPVLPPISDVYTSPSRHWFTLCARPRTEGPAAACTTYLALEADLLVRYTFDGASQSQHGPIRQRVIAALEEWEGRATRRTN